MNNFSQKFLYFSKNCYKKTIMKLIVLHTLHRAETKNCFVRHFCVANEILALEIFKIMNANIIFSLALSFH